MQSCFLEAEKWVARSVEREKFPAAFWRSPHSPFFALGKFTVDFEDDVPHNAREVHGKLLSSHIHWKPLSVRTKSFSTGGFPSSCTRADRFTLGNSRRWSYVCRCFSGKILLLFRGCVILTDELISFSFRMMTCMKLCFFLRTTFWEIYWKNDSR